MSSSRSRKNDQEKDNVSTVDPTDPRELLARLIGELLAKDWLNRQVPKSTRQDSVD